LKANGDETDYTNQADADTALEILTSLFSTQKEFSSDSKARKFLDRAVSESDAEVLGKIHKFAQIALRDVDIKNDQVELKAGDMRSLTKQLRPYAQENNVSRDGDQQTLWPLVKTIRIYCDNPVLRQGVIIVDLPGGIHGSQDQYTLMIS
jgi:hypothetical protein